jgi:peptidoglycan-associated lipoprotein
MVRRSVCGLTVVLFVLSCLLFASCSKRVVQEEEEEGTVGTEEDKGLKGEGVTEEGLDDARRRLEELRKKEGIKLSNVYFSFDDFSLSEEAKNTLVENAAWLMNHPENKVAIGGHCDERGTGEYNLALGERRSNSAKRYLINLGVNASQISTISYGEEKPADPGNTEEAWAKNRRGESVVQ